MQLKAVLLTFFSIAFLFFNVMYWLAFVTLGTGMLTAGSTVGLVFTILPLAALLK